jgi:hypothetical protein
VKYHQRAITRSDDILLEVVGAHGIRQRFRRKRVFRQVAGGATVRDYDRPHTLNNINKNS